MITHVAGAVVAWTHCGERRVIQRCAACGQKLIDNAGAMMQVGERFPTWKEGALVAVDAGQPTQSVMAGMYVEVPTLPNDFCGFLE